MKKKGTEEVPYDFPGLEIIDLEQASGAPAKGKKPAKKSAAPKRAIKAADNDMDTDADEAGNVPGSGDAPEIVLGGDDATGSDRENDDAMGIDWEDDAVLEIDPEEDDGPEIDLGEDDGLEIDLKDDDMPEIDLGEDDGLEIDPEEPADFFHRVNWHALFAVCAVLAVALIFWRILNYGTRLNLNDFGYVERPDVMDSIVPLLLPDELKPVDDGVTTIVAFGNAPFADDRDAEDSLAHLIEEMSGAVVYNCSVSGSYLAAQADAIPYNPLDAFNLYWLAYSACMQEDENLQRVYQEAFEELGGDIPPEGEEVYRTLLSIDFSKVDVIVIMYDGSDYLAGHEMYSDDSFTDIYQFTGNMAASIQQLQSTYPHIRIIVMSPTFVYAVNEDGDYVSSETYRYGQDTLSTYVIKQEEAAYRCRVSFVDNLYGTITEDNASKYLKDNLHLNADGRRLVAERFVYALNYFDQDFSSDDGSAFSGAQ